MKKLFTQKQYKNSKAKDLLPLQCHNCNKIFYQKKSEITRTLKHKTGGCKFCSRKCLGKNRENRIKIHCTNCNIVFYRALSLLKKSKNYFCSRPCAAQYNNLHKKHGTRRSKLEKWLEQQLSIIYPNLKILYNDKQAINAELDIYIPSLKLAIEINGIFHYEPIFGESKLNQIQNNDKRKHQACHEHNIEILWLDTSSLKYFKPENAQKYLDIITKIIKQKLSIFS